MIQSANAPHTRGTEEVTPRGLAGWLYRHVPALDALRTYSRADLGRDMMAGLTVATVAVPQAMAYATLAGLPPQYGLYTAIVMTAVGALFDSSRLLINGPTNAISIALLSALVVIAPEDRLAAAILLAFLVGVTQTAIALLRLGDLTRYVSHSVIIGFTLGAGALLVLDQTKYLLGLAARGSAEAHFLTRFWLSLTTGGGVHAPTVMIGAGTIALVLGIRWFNTWRRARGARFPIPQHLVAVLLMAGLVWWLRLDDEHGVSVVGAIPAALPSFAVPEVKWDQVRLLAGNAFAIAMLGLLEAVAMAKAIARRTGQKLDLNQQCLSEGLANLSGSFFQCFPGSGSLTRSAVNQQVGAVSQWSGVFSAAAVAATVLLFAPVARYIPHAALAGLLMLAAFRMVDWKQLAFHLRATRFDAGVVLATALAAVVISVELCIIIGVFLSFVLYVPRAGHVRLTPLTRVGDRQLRERRAGDPPEGAALIYGLEGELFFGAEPELERHFAGIDRAARGEVREVILVLARARNPDAAFLGLLDQLAAELHKRGVRLLLSGAEPDLRAALAGTGLGAGLAARTLPEASEGSRGEIDLAYARLDEVLCPTGPRGGRREGS